MPTILKTRREIEMMRHAGRIAHDILRKMKAAAVVGVTTGELDELAAHELSLVGGRGMSRNYPTYREGRGSPATLASASMKRSSTASRAGECCGRATSSPLTWH